MKKSLVSVVVPTFNRAELIVDALDSIYAQSYRPLEVVVVDDGSTDETAAMVGEWIVEHELSELFWGKYIRQDNLGGNVARNRGIGESSGEFVAFLDSDDRWHIDKLSKQMAVMSADAAVGAVYCGLRHWYADENRVALEVARKYPSGDILSQMLVHDVTSPTSCYLIRKSMFDEVGLFDEELQARQDWDMWIRLAEKCCIGVVPEALVDYREHAGVRTVSNPQKEISAYRRIMDKYAELRRKQSFAVRQAAKASFYRRMGRVYFHQKISIIKAFGYLLLAIVVWPFVFDSYAALFGMLLPQNFRSALHRFWNRLFGATPLAIKSH